METAKWEGKSSVNLTGVSSDQVWPLVADFCNLHKWLPIDICRCVEGDPSVPGCVRFCARTSADGQVENYANEKLTVIDPAARFLTYVVMENSVGFGAYEATIKVIDADDTGNESSKGSCVIEWYFVCDPVVGWGRDGLLDYIHSSLQTMAKRMEDALGSSESSVVGTM